MDLCLNSKQVLYLGRFHSYGENHWIALFKVELSSVKFTLSSTVSFFSHVASQ